MCGNRGVAAQAQWNHLACMTTAGGGWSAGQSLEVGDSRIGGIWGCTGRGSWEGGHPVLSGRCVPCTVAQFSQYLNVQG